MCLLYAHLPCDWVILWGEILAFVSLLQKCNEGQEILWREYFLSYSSDSQRRPKRRDCLPVWPRPTEGGLPAFPTFRHILGLVHKLRDDEPGFYLVKDQPLQLQAPLVLLALKPREAKFHKQLEGELKSGIATCCGARTSGTWNPGRKFLVWQPEARPDGSICLCCCRAWWFRPFNKQKKTIHSHGFISLQHIHRLVRFKVTSCGVLSRLLMRVFASSCGGLTVRNYY